MKMNKVEKHAEICKSLNELYARKNADYGDSFGKSFAEYGLTMACIRLEDKLNRIKSLTKQAAQVHDESIVDTLMDLANYSIMTLVELAQDEPEEAQDEPEEARESAPRGDCNGHCASCGIKYSTCQCLTCARDDSGTTVLSCCVKHRHACGTRNCPDYVREGS
jgi:hypothetical protein